ncbi:Uncharacterised protein [Chryseobacterium jejuense]|uniref:Uncharacterized protein n=1 Tax=Chryseobacterium jejuense TaxID=445960 RepID=A0A2X2XM77_CHRJE|nr:Uncharacterised protein [Chryseobacterium jejuense]
MNYYQESLSGIYSDDDLAKRYKNQNQWVSKAECTPYPHVPAMVHEGSTLPIENENGIDAVVNLEYQLINRVQKEMGNQQTKEYENIPVSNLFITGASLWAQSGAWNPTLTMTAMALQLADKRIAAKKVRKSIHTKEKSVSGKEQHANEVGLMNFFL